MSLGQTASPQPQSAPPPQPVGNPPPQSAPAAALEGSVQPAAVTPASETPPARGLGDNGGPDWRAMLAGEDTKALERLARYNNPTDVTKALIEAQTKLSQRSEPPKLPDNATPQQVAEWRKGLGVPDVAADAKADAYLAAYGIKAPEGYEVSPVESSMLEGFAKHAYDQGLSPRDVKASADFFFKAQAQTAQAMQQRDMARQKEWITELRDEWGRDFDARLAAGEAFLNQRFNGNDAAKRSLLTAQLADGGRLGDNPEFIRLVSDLAMQNGFTDRIEANALESNGKSLAERQSELETLRRTNRELYNDPATQDQLKKIYQLRLTRGEIDEQGNEIRKSRRA